MTQPSDIDWAKYNWPQSLFRASDLAGTTDPDTGALPWHDRRQVFGFDIRAYFFDALIAEAQTEFCQRMLPIFQQAAPLVWVTDADKRDFKAGNLIARPDAVLVHGNCLISLEYKSQSGRNASPTDWPRKLPTAGLLQCLAAAMAVAVHTGQPVAPMLRCHNAVYFLHPKQQVVDYLIKQIDVAPAIGKARAG